MKIVDFFSSLIINCVLSAKCGKNDDIAVSRLMRYCTTLMLLGLLISLIARHFSRFASILLRVRINPRSLSPSTPKTHFFGLRHIL